MRIIAFAFACIQLSINAQAQGPTASSAPAHRLAISAALDDNGSLTLGFGAAAIISEPDTTSSWRYFPLGHGDVWEYEFTSGRTMRQYVNGDTLVNGRRYPLLFQQDFSPAGVPSPFVVRYFIVSDTAGAIVTYPEGFVDCPLNAPFGSTLICRGLNTTVGGGYDGVLVFRGGTPSPDTVRTAVKTYSDGFSVRRYAAGLGLVYQFCGECTDPERALRGARIGGVTYGALRYPVVVAGEAAPAPAPVSLQVAPNPTTGQSTLTLALPGAADVRAEAYDLLGRRVAVLAEGALGAGHHALTLDGGGLAAGVYVVRAVVTSGTLAPRVLTQRLTVAR